MIKRIHVNQHKIKSNTKTGKREKVLSIKMGGKVFYANQVLILGPSKIVYSPDKPLSCGARVWVETEEDIIMDEGVRK